MKIGDAVEFDTPLAGTQEGVVAWRGSYHTVIETLSYGVPVSMAPLERYPGAQFHEDCCYVLRLNCNVRKVAAKHKRIPTTFLEGIEL